LDRDASREVVDHIHILEQSPKLGAVAYIPAREMDIRRQHFRVSSGKVVQSAYLMSLTGEMVCKRRAEETRGSSDEKIHNEIIASEIELKRWGRSLIQ